MESERSLASATAKGGAPGRLVHENVKNENKPPRAKG